MRRMDWMKRYGVKRRSIFAKNVEENPLKKNGVASPRK
jgi:hypothetical protein